MGGPRNIDHAADQRETGRCAWVWVLKLTCAEPSPVPATEMLLSIALGPANFSVPSMRLNACKRWRIGSAFAVADLLTT